MRGVLLGLGIAVSIWLALIVILWVAGRGSAAHEVATLIPNLLVLFRGLFGDPRVSRGSKALVGLAIVWLISPIDLIPEFIPVAGPLDDAIVAALVLRYVLRHTDRIADSLGFQAVSAAEYSKSADRLLKHGYL